MTKTLDSLPKYLQKYCIRQDYDAYTPRDHAVWRYIMRQNRRFFCDHAACDYDRGLRETGLDIERIPRLSEMDAALSKLGWGAVGVSGFIPPAVFIEFQSRRILPIATYVRTAAHIGYTPAPDIVHEAAGHAPILIQPAYAEFLQRYGEMARWAYTSIDDVRIYEAIRYLSDLKEDPHATSEAIAQATEALHLAESQAKGESEALKLSRLYWWTAEYGLVGNPAQPKIYGAGLLSSVKESQNCLASIVRKVTLDIDCVYQGYDITEPQPQLFVVPKLDDLPDVVERFGKTLGYHQPAHKVMPEVLRLKHRTSAIFARGFSISGTLEQAEPHPHNPERFAYMRWTGPSQICLDEKELPGRGAKAYPEGFHALLGHLLDTKGISVARHRRDYVIEPADLTQLGLTPGARAKLNLDSGYSIEGVFLGIGMSSDDQGQSTVQSLRWQNATLKRGEHVITQPRERVFEQWLIDDLKQVYGGVMDRDAFGTYEMGQARTRPGQADTANSTSKAATATGTVLTSPPEHPSELMQLYASVRELRQSIAKQKQPLSEAQKKQLTDLLQCIETDYPKEWLLALEIAEISKGQQRFVGSPNLKPCSFDKDTQWLIEKGREAI